MNVLLSWSGSKSNKAAEVFHDWMTVVLPGSHPRLSSEDISCGPQGFSALMEQLAPASFCILFLTPQNVRSPWLYFEAGAIATRQNSARVCSYLIGVASHQLSAGPLSQFQWTEATKEGTWKLVRELNRGLPTPHDERLLEPSFSQAWPALKRKLDVVLTEQDDESPRGVETQASPADYDLTEEARTLLRESAEDRSGVILMLRTLGGLIIQTNAKQFAQRGNARSEATWQAAVRQLLQLGLLENRGAKGEVFGLTVEGFRVGERLRQQVHVPSKTAG